MFFYQKHSLFDIFTVFYPLLHAFFTNHLIIPFLHSLLSQAFPKGGLRLCTKVDGFRGGLQRKC